MARNKKGPQLNDQVNTWFTKCTYLLSTIAQMHIYTFNVYSEAQTSEA